MRVARRRLRAVLGVAAFLGCAAGSGPAEPPFAPSGFLGDYSAFRAGGADRARLVYLDPSVDFSGYERVVIEPTVVWKSDEARFAGVSPAQREALARAFGAELERAFAAEFVVAEDANAPGTLRVRNAVTAAIDQDSDPERLQYIEVELELRDAVTNARLAAAVDSRGTREAPQSVETGAAFAHWAERVAVRVAALRDFDRAQR
jgi:hypothetical protein